MKKILFVASEAVPFISSGGLGDVMGSLPQKIIADGSFEVSVFLPLYSQIDDGFREKFNKVCEYTVNLAWRKQYCGIYSYIHNGVKYYFADNEFYFKRASMYGNYDDEERYAFFCMACLEMLRNIDDYPDIIHANDWQSALTVIYLRTLYAHVPKYNNIKTVFTLHNIEYQGKYGIDILWDVFSLPNEYKKLVEYGGNINLLKGAIEACDILTTVSDRYSKEIQTEYFGCGISYILRKNSDKCIGIINGIDTERYSPDNDGVFCKYSASDLRGKTECKLYLQNYFSLPISEEKPVIAMISRLAEHKGFDLVKCVAEELLVQDIQLIILGTGEKSLEDYFISLAEKYADKVAVRIEFNKELSQKIYSGADIFLMPSRSEPCGLSQMIAARYGTIPIVHRVGGLYDSIIPFNSETLCGNGFTFDNYNAHDMLYTVKNAVELYKQKDIRERIIKNAMTTDFSWETSAKKYCAMYERL